MDLAFNVEKLLGKVKKNNTSKGKMEQSLFFEKQMSEMQKLIDKQGKKGSADGKQMTFFEGKKNPKELVLKEKVNELEKKVDVVKAKIVGIKQGLHQDEMKKLKEKPNKTSIEPYEMEKNKVRENQKQNGLKIENEKYQSENPRLKNMAQKDHVLKVENVPLQEKIDALKEEMNDVKETVMELKEYRTSQSEVEGKKEKNILGENLVEEKKAVVSLDEKKTVESNENIKEISSAMKEVENELKQIEDELKKIEKEEGALFVSSTEGKDQNVLVDLVVRQEIVSVLENGKNPIVKEKETMWSERVVLGNENASFTKGLSGEKSGMGPVVMVSEDQKDESKEVEMPKQNVSAVFGEILNLIKQDRMVENEITQENKAAIISVTVSLNEERTKKDALKQKQESEIQQLKLVSNLLDTLKPDLEKVQKQEKSNEPIAMDTVKKTTKGKMKTTEEMEEKSVKTVEEGKEVVKIDHAAATKEQPSEKIEVKSGKVQENNHFKELLTMAEKKDVELKVVQQDKIVFSIANGQVDGEVEVEVTRENENIVVKFQVEEVKAKVKLEEMMVEMKEEFKKKGIEMEINIEVKQGKDEEKQREHKKEKEEYPSMAKPSNGDNDNQEESFLEKINQWIGG